MLRDLAVLVLALVLMVLVAVIGARILPTLDDERPPTTTTSTSAP